MSIVGSDSSENIIDLATIIAIRPARTLCKTGWLQSGDSMFESQSQGPPSCVDDSAEAEETEAKRARML